MKNKGREQNLMYMRYYDGYPSSYVPNDEQSPKDSEYTKSSEDKETQSGLSEISPAESIETASALSGGLFSSVRTDDIILIALLFIILSENRDDYIMPAVIGFLLMNR